MKGEDCYYSIYNTRESLAQNLICWNCVSHRRPPGGGFVFSPPPKNVVER